MLTILQAVACLIIITKNASRKIQIGILNFTSSSPGFSGPNAARKRWIISRKWNGKAKSIRSYLEELSRRPTIVQES